MCASIVRLQRLIDDLTDMTRLETGRLRLIRSATDPVALVERIVQGAMSMLPDHPIHLTVPRRAIASRRTP